MRLFVCAPTDSAGLQQHCAAGCHSRTHLLRSLLDSRMSPLTQRFAPGLDLIDIRYIPGKQYHADAGTHLQCLNAMPPSSKAQTQGYHNGHPESIPKATGHTRTAPVHKDTRTQIIASSTALKID